MFTQRLVFGCQRSMHGRAPAVPVPTVCASGPPRSGGTLAAPRSMEVVTACAAVDPLSDLVEIAGLEPAASGLQSRRSPN